RRNTIHRSALFQVSGEAGLAENNRIQRHIPGALSQLAPERESNVKIEVERHMADSSRYHLRSIPLCGGPRARGRVDATPYQRILRSYLRWTDSTGVQCL